MNRWRECHLASAMQNGGWPVSSTRPIPAAAAANRFVPSPYLSHLENRQNSFRQVAGFAGSTSKAAAQSVALHHGGERACIATEVQALPVPAPPDAGRELGLAGLPPTMAVATLSQVRRCVAPKDRAEWASQLVEWVHPSVRVAELPGRGHCLVVESPIKEGTLLLKERPLVSLPAQDFPESGQMSEM